MLSRLIRKQEKRLCVWPGKLFRSCIVTCCNFERMVPVRIRGLKTNETLNDEAVDSLIEEVIGQYFDRLMDGWLIQLR